MVDYDYDYEHDYNHETGVNLFEFGVRRFLQSPFTRPQSEIYCWK